MADVLNVESREQRGKNQVKHLRREGRIPAVLYGHGGDSVCLSLPADELAALLRSRVHVVDLQGPVKEKALIQELQWDSFGNEVLHVDLTRVRAGEKVIVTVPVTLRGVAPGTKVGGVVQQALHEVEIEAPVTDVPEELVVNINSLELDETLALKDLELPEGVTVQLSEDATVVQCLTAMEETEEDEESASTAEPEVIGRKDEGEAEEGD